MAAKAPIALRFIKEAVNKGLDLTLEQGLHLEGDLYFLLHTTSDRTEGISAFLEKRTPVFKGKYEPGQAGYRLLNPQKLANTTSEIYPSQKPVKKLVFITDGKWKTVLPCTT